MVVNVSSENRSAPLPEVTGTDVHIEVAVALPVSGTFTYRVSASMGGEASVGKRVLVPFGRRRVTGYVLGQADPDAVPTGTKILKILDILDETALFPAEMVPFFRWTADYYLHPLGAVIETALPGGINPYEERIVSLNPEAPSEREGPRSPLKAKVLDHLQAGPCSVRSLQRQVDATVTLASLRRLRQAGYVRWERRLRPGAAGPRTERWVSAAGDPSEVVEALTDKRRAIYERLLAEGPLPVRALRETAATAPAILRRMADAGQVTLFDRPVHRDPFGEPITPEAPHQLTPDQDRVVSAAGSRLGDGYAAFLLTGVTGSGKTEVYLHLTAAALDQDRSVVVLVPEIALMSQMARRFRARFGERVAVLHSGLSAGQRHDQWMRISRGEAPVVLGARSAVFAPVFRPGLLVVDEEHDSSYKQDGGLFYNARDLAAVRAKDSGAVLILGSATPSVQSIYNVRIGKLTDLRLPERVAARPLPEITVVDLKMIPPGQGPRRWFTPPLLAAMSRSLADGEQVLLFLNRRGYATFPVCVACGEAMRCRNCDVTLTYHQSKNAYRCHLCGYFQGPKTPCGVCGDPRIKRLGFGTEKIEAAARALFPEARVARLDRDTTARKGSLVRILKQLRDGEIDILVGTQMITKGHDFPNITLVGIICADLSLSFPDFRAGERTFQLLAQVAGRAGRGDRPGRVILQTYNPTHYSITAARAQDVERFYHREIEFRKPLGYPPFSRLIQLRIRARDHRKAEAAARELGDACARIRESAPERFGSVEVLGPIEAAVPRVAGYHRWRMLLKGTRSTALRGLVRALESEAAHLFSAREVRISVDVDPFFMY
jgi:primosomal protein N' (replication factor Y) (superfamily II helicase)